MKTFSDQISHSPPKPLGLPSPNKYLLISSTTLQQISFKNSLSSSASIQIVLGLFPGSIDVGSCYLTVTLYQSLKISLPLQVTKDLTVSMIPTCTNFCNIYHRDHTWTPARWERQLYAASRIADRIIANRVRWTVRYLYSYNGGA